MNIEKTYQRIDLSPPKADQPLAETILEETVLNKRGFTITELMVVILIIAVMIAVGLASFIGFHGSASVKNAVRDVASTMRLAQSKAITNYEEYLAIYDLNNETIWVQSYSSYTASGKSPDHGTEKKMPKEVYIARVTAGGGGQATGSGNPGGTLDSGIGYHKFTITGGASTGTVYLRDKDNEIQHRLRLGPTGQPKIISNWD